MAVPGSGWWSTSAASAPHQSKPHPLWRRPMPTSEGSAEIMAVAVVAIVRLLLQAPRLLTIAINRVGATNRVHRRSSRRTILIITTNNKTTLRPADMKTGYAQAQDADQEDQTSASDDVTDTGTGEPVS